MHRSTLLWLLALVQLGNTAAVTIASSNAQATPTLEDHEIFAIVPTTSGQIGINPVESDLGDPATYIGDIYGTDTQYITVIDPDTTTKWIGVNTQYLSMDGPSTVQVVVATATAAANGQSIGDISIILPEGLAVSLKNSVETAITACGEVVGKVRRQYAGSEKVRRQMGAVLSCVLGFAEEDAKTGELIDSYVTGQQLEDAGLTLAEDASAVLVNYFASLASKSQFANTILWLAVYAAIVIDIENVRLSGDNTAVKAVGKFNIPHNGFGAKPPKKGCTGKELKNKESLLCREYICQGENAGFCTLDPYMNCPCILTIPLGKGPQIQNTSYLDFQQQWLLDIANGEGDTLGAGGQQIALASYINPLADPASWDRMIGYPVDKVSVLVANVINGPGTVLNTDWEGVINRAHASGKRIIGYVRTGYLGVSWQQYQTLLGSHELVDWAAQIQVDVDLWYTLYPGKIGGIFFDEGWNECGDNNQYAELYRLITENTKRKYPGAFTVLNPGATMPQCFEHSADTLMTFESSYESYTGPNYTSNLWTASDSRKIWHIIFNVPSDKAADIAALALERGAGLVHITSDNLPNPYDTIPDESYMQTLINAVSGGTTAVSDPLPFPNDGSSASQPTGLSVTAFDYTSVSLSWSSGSGTPLAFAIFLAKKEIVRLPGTMSHATIGNLKPGSSGLIFSVYAIGGDGSISAASNSVTASTLSLPGGQTVTNVMVTSTATTTTYQADILVPYAFLRVFISDPDTACSLPGWPIGYNAGYHVCTHYMVEAETLYTYSGANLTGGDTNWPWSWAQQGAWANVPIDRNVYTYKWTLPIGTSTVDPTHFVVQAEGYGPFTNVFNPCPDHWNSFSPNEEASCVGTVPYDCKGQALCSTTNVKFCDEAVNNMQRGSKIYTSNGVSLAFSGNCWANWEQFGCQVYIQGTDENGDNCKITGDDMWNAYQDIRNIGGCSTCGSKHFGNGCIVSIDYYFGCDNRDPGVNRRVAEIAASDSNA